MGDCSPYLNDCRTALLSCASDLEAEPMVWTPGSCSTDFKNRDSLKQSTHIECELTWEGMDSLFKEQDILIQFITHLDTLFEVTDLDL